MAKKKAEEEEMGGRGVGMFLGFISKEEGATIVVGGEEAVALSTNTLSISATHFWVWFTSI